MDGGRIVERGAHQQLLAARGWYAQMWAMQQSSEATKD
jgi:ABC-type multidrug transport system fused ATPase/permease subunit